MAVKTILCQFCFAEVPDARKNRKYCRSCAARRRQRQQTATHNKAKGQAVDQALLGLDPESNASVAVLTKSIHADQLTEANDLGHEVRAAMHLVGSLEKVGVRFDY